MDSNIESASNYKSETVGVLALQGCVEPHLDRLREINVNAKRVRSPSELEGVTRLIIPGGESTTMLSLIKRLELEKPLYNFALNRPIWGICAGAILIAKEVKHPEQFSFGFINISATRNFYGSQLDSFTTDISLACIDKTSNKPLTVDFIRAPKLEALSTEVEVLAKHDTTAVMFKQGHILASSFHCELRSDNRLHRYFLSI